MIIALIIVGLLIFWWANYESEEDKQARIDKEIKEFEKIWETISAEMKEEVYQDFKENMDRYDKEKK